MRRYRSGGSVDGTDTRGVLVRRGLRLICAGAGLLLLAVSCGGGQTTRRSPEAEVGAKVRMAQAKLRIGRPVEALAAMEEAIRIDPDNAGLQNFYGQIFMVAGQYPEAEKALKRALELDPRLTDAHNNLGALYDEIGRDDEAEREYLLALDDPTFLTPEKVHLNLGILYANQGREEEALSMLRRAVEIAPRYFKAHFELAGLLDRQGKLEEALREYEVARPGYRNSGEFHYRIGFTYFRLGEHVQAAQELRRVLEVAPGSDVAARADELMKMIP